MHIVFVTRELATSNNSSGGLASFTANIARIFAANGHKVSIVLAATKQENLTFDENIDLYTTFVEMKKWKRMDVVSKMAANVLNDSEDEIRRMLIALYKSMQVRRTIDKINKKEKIDIVHYCYPGMLNMRAKNTIPYVVRISAFYNIWNGGAQTPNGSVEYKDNPLTIRNRMDEKVLKKAKYVISPSKRLAQFCEDDLGICPVVIESPFVKINMQYDYSVYKETCENKRYILHYGTQSYMKGTHVVAQVASRVLDKYKDVYLVLVGRDQKMQDEKGNIYKAKELVRKQANEFADRVICIDKLTREQLYPVIENAEICLLPSRIDNFPNTCVEAMAMGKIVVATNGASFEQLIEDEMNGFLCERDSVESFIEGISKALELSDGDREAMGLNAKKSVERLEPQKVYKNFLSYYQKVIVNWD